jgi:glycosyltransferase involved in cell wall biosynthesis
VNRTGVYIPSSLKYANQYLLRQATGIPDAVVVTRHPQGLDVGDVQIEVRTAGPRSQLGDLGVRAAISASRRSGMWPLDPWSASRLRRAYRDLDVAYTMFLPNAAELVHALRRADLALAAHAAGSDVTGLGGVRRTFAEWNLRAARDVDIVLSGSQFLQDRLHELTTPTRSEVHYIGVPVADELAPSQRSADRDATIVFIAVSRLHPVKGVRFTIAAFHRAFADRNDVELRIVGDGPELEDARRDAAAGKAADRIHFLGELGRDAVDAQIVESDVFVQHNQRLADGAEEAVGGSILEAAALGLPVVAARSGGVAEAVVDGVTGRLVESHDVAAMADAMAELADDPALRTAFGRAGHALVRERHNAAVQDRRLRELLSGL